MNVSNLRLLLLRKPKLIMDESAQVLLQLAMQKAAHDPLFLKDIEDCMDDFRYIDEETIPHEHLT